VWPVAKRAHWEDAKPDTAGTRIFVVAMIDGLRLEDGEYGRRAVAISAWSPEMTEYLLRNDVVELELNHAKGWRGNDLSFLAALPKLASFTIIDLGIASVEPIHSLHDLRTLGVTTYCKTEIRFSAFPRLTKCVLEWRPKATSLFDCSLLTSLFLNRYNGKDTASFANLAKLEWLGILNAPIENINGLSNLRNMRYLRLGNLRKLTSLAGIESLSNLERLDLQTCRAIGSIREVAFLSKLQQFHLSDDGDIASLEPLRTLTHLTTVTFAESTNIIDGDLSPLFLNKNLSRVSFQNRRHYSHRREEFGFAYTGVRND